MIVFMRHAERGDNQIPQLLSEVAYDPPIIDAGKQTVAQAAKNLIEILENYGIKKYKVVCSKFLRCLMTMKELEKHLIKAGYQSPSQYILDDRVSQYLRDSWYPEYPLPNLIYKTNHLGKYINTENLSYVENKYNLTFPQNFPTFQNRVNEFKNNIKFPDPDTMIIVMTHGFFVRSICFQMNQIPNFQDEVKYCGFAAYTKKDKSEYLIKSSL